MKIKVGIVLMAIGFVLMAVVAGWNLYLQNEESAAETEANAALPEVLAAMEQSPEEQATPSPTPSPMPEEPADAEPSFTAETMPSSSPAPAETPTADSSTQPPAMKVVYAKNKPYVGTLRIPSLGIELPVQAEWSYKKLKHTPCHYSGTAEGGDMVLIAHNYKGHFGRLKDLSIGAEIIFTDAEGRIFTYAVDAHETLRPNQKGYLTAGDWELSLATCTVGGAMREVVRCTIVSAP